jgi:ribosome-associated protein
MKSMDVNTLLDKVKNSLEDMKAEDIKVIDVREKTGVTDYMVIATGRSNRHVKAIAETAMLDIKKATGESYLSEGEEAGEWVLVDFFDLVLHVMQPETREFYSLEKIWEVTDSRRPL